MYNNVYIIIINYFIFIDYYYVYCYIIYLHSHVCLLKPMVFTKIKWAKQIDGHRTSPH